MIDLSSDGRQLLEVHGNGRGGRLGHRPRVVERRACELANRTLTREEWEEFLPGRPYEPACRKHELASGADRPGEARQRGRRSEAAGA